MTAGMTDFYEVSRSGNDLPAPGRPEALTLEAAASVVQDTGRSLRSWLLGGDARVVARGTLLRGAAAIPSPPAWC